MSVQFQWIRNLGTCSGFPPRVKVTKISRVHPLWSRNEIRTFHLSTSDFIFTCKADRMSRFVSPLWAKLADSPCFHSLCQAKLNMCCTHRWNSEDFIFNKHWSCLCRWNRTCDTNTSNNSPCGEHLIQQANSKIARNDLICLTVVHISLLQPLPPPSTRDTYDVSRAGGSSQLLNVLMILFTLDWSADCFVWWKQWVMCCQWSRVQSNTFQKMIEIMSSFLYVESFVYIKTRSVFKFS